MYSPWEARSDGGWFVCALSMFMSSLSPIAWLNKSSVGLGAAADLRATADFQTAMDSQVAVAIETGTWSAQDSAMSKQRSCVICMEDFEEGVLIERALCSHIFHDHCFRTWHSHSRSRKRLCPFGCHSSV
eukprot:TRINITY_DN115453_c0_g1_i1.p1 TRINITY_DN115453_c0_g1~~TRINITY_DN115453_c0_g1_i1.p1  ORF type:complete len:130 (+),score=7.38 TRINITY_DN115453_c0_g1_i1:44-433(+)